MMPGVSGAAAPIPPDVPFVCSCLFMEGPFLRRLSLQLSHGLRPNRESSGARLSQTHEIASARAGESGTTDSGTPIRTFVVLSRMPFAFVLHISDKTRKYWLITSNSNHQHRVLFCRGDFEE